MKRQYLFVLGLVLVMLALTGATRSPSAPPRDNATIPQPRSGQAGLADTWGKLPLYFVANQGQVDERVDFYVQGSDKTLYFTPEGVTFALTDLTTGEGKNRWIVKLDFVDANAVRPGGRAQTDAIISYFKGPQEARRTGLPTYSQIVYRDLWEGIDLTYSGTVNRLKYEFVVQPGADPARIRLAYRGATVRLKPVLSEAEGEAGQLEVSTPAGGFQDDAPVAYQEVDGQRAPVAVAFALEDATMPGAYGFRLGAYNPALPLVIDPAVLVYCGYIGGNGDDLAYGIAVDTAGSAYVTGYTTSISTTFPVTVGPDLDYHYSYDAFVAKVKADGTGLVYAGYIGGSGADVGNGIAVDAAGNAYVTGWTNSGTADFPATVGPDLTYSGSNEAFVAKVITDGTRLVYAGFIGGSDNDIGHGIAVDAAGNAYVTGYTFSSEATFSVTVGPDLTFNNVTYERDAFVVKVKADGTGFDYAGYIGGGGYDDGLGIAVDSAGSAYVTGFTDSISTTFPVTVGPSINYNGGMYDAFVAKVKADGTGFDYAGYIGGYGWDQAYGIAVDSARSAYVTGWTGSPFPVTIGPDLTFNGGLRDAFVAKVKVDGTGLVYAGYLGGSNDDDWGKGIAVDSAGNAYVTGYTNSTEATFPETRGPDLTYNGGYYDAFVAKVRTDGTRLMYCGYIGGSGEDQGNGIAVDSAGNAYVTGHTASISTTFPVTVGPDLTYNLGTYDAFVAKVFFSIENSTTTVASSLNPSTFGQSVTFTATVSGGAGAPTGTVQFKVDSVNLGAPVTLVGGSASVSTAALALGVHTVTAEYSGDATYDSSTGTLSPNQTVNKQATTTTVASSLNPSTYGQSVTFTATVSGGAGTPTGTVQFKVDSVNLSTPVTLVGGSASVSTAALALGVHTVTAEYDGNTTYDSSTGTLSPNQAVNKQATTTTVASSLNPSTYGQSVTFTATVSGGAGTPTGTVQFKVDSVNLGTPVTLVGGNASVSTAALAIGVHTVTAEYNGSVTYDSSTGTLSPNQMVNKQATTTAVTSSLNPSTYGQSVVFTATVHAGSGAPTGTVAFKDGGSAIVGCAAQPLSSGQATCATAALAAGVHIITAEYSGNATYDSSIGTLSPNQTVNKQATTTTVTSSPNPSTYGQSVTFTATVSAGSGTPTGTVAFKDGGSVIAGCAAQPLSSGQATCATAALAAGAHIITAEYSGDANYGTSTGTLSGGQVVDYPFKLYLPLVLR